MLFSTPTQFIVLLLVLIVGWLLGLATHPGGKKWKQALRDEESARKQDVAERDTRISELEARNKELAADLDKATTATQAVAAAAAAAPTEKRGWFGRDRGDDLTRLRGVDDDLARVFKTEGVDSYAALANLSDQDEIALERRIDMPAGYIARERLREQAKLLADGHADEHARLFG